jgi:hypothetical protein
MNIETFSDWKKRIFSGFRFRKDYLKRAGKIFKKEGDVAAEAYLTGKHESSPPNFQPPAKCHIVSKSRPFEEWTIYQASVNIQSYIYGLTFDEIKTTEPGTSKETHQQWFNKTSVATNGFASVQGLNLIFGHAKNRFLGVITKVENRNEKKKKRKDKDQGVDLEVAFDETGHLLQPPGINHSIYCYQQVSPQAFTHEKFPQVILPKEYEGYKVDPVVPIPNGPENRLEIPKGMPGYVPEHQRGEISSNKHKRMRQPYAFGNVKPKPGRTSKFDHERYAQDKAKGALLAVLKIGEDWVVFDVRGLLRNVQWRNLLDQELTLNSLLELFTGDPVIDTKRELITFTYKLGVVNVCSLKKPITGKRSKELLERLTASTEDGKAREIAAISIDLGQTNPIAAGIYRIGRNDNGALKETLIHSAFLSDDLLKEIASYRKQYDLMEAKLRSESTLLLTKEQQDEIVKIETFSENDAKQALCKDFGIDLKDLPWSEMSSVSTYVSDYIVDHGGDPEKVFFETKSKKDKTKRYKRRDSGWAKMYCPQLSKETRQAKNDALWELKRKSPEYIKFSKRKQEFTRRCRNWLLNEAKKYSQCETVIPIIEDLNVSFFHGAGKREPGWENFFLPKQENRWFIQALHKAFTEICVHRGMPVIEVYPARTSQTCPDLACRHCDSNNREGEKFQCVKCGKIYHADLEVAVPNILWVAMNGQRMPKGESLGDEEKPVAARSRKPPKQEDKLEDALQRESIVASINGGARKASRNAA